MEAYAALLSLKCIIEQIQHHPRPPISLDENQVQSLTENITFLQEFLDVSSHVQDKKVDQLRSRIVDAAYAAEDVIESHTVDQIRTESGNHAERTNGPNVDVYQRLQKVIQNMALIIEDAMEVQEKMGSVQDIEVRQSSSVPKVGSSRSPLKGQNTIVGLGEVLTQLKDKLTRRQSKRQIIQIVGMGGIGKTTLAKTAYEDSLIVEHFDTRAWTTISQAYCIKEILLKILSCQKGQEDEENLHKRSADELGEVLHKSLFSRRYLIIIDDVWDIKVWDNLKFFLPDNNNGSRIVITTRLSITALPVPSAFALKMNFLDEKSSWTLLCKIVFGEDGCPLELREIGKEIAKKCDGLPLSVVVIGGLLAKSERTREYWESIVENLNSIVNLEDNEYCFKLLYMSYNYLPVHLKPCFLYMGVFREDIEIYVSDLIKLWVAEGFLKPIMDKSWEEIAEEYLKDLIDRNLILILKWKSSGKVKSCKIHDLVRELCLREAHKENFLCVTKQHSFHNILQGIIDKRRIASHGSTWKDLHQVPDALQFASLARSLVCQSSGILTSPYSKLLRVLKTHKYDSQKDVFSWQVNLRYFAARKPYSSGSLERYRIPSSIYLLWNLQTLIIPFATSTIEIWRLPLLRHVKLQRLILPNHSNGFSSKSLGLSDKEDDFFLGNVQTLSNVVNFKWSENMVKMIPNIKKLRIFCDENVPRSNYCLNNLADLHKLESLNLNFDPATWLGESDLQNLSFPDSLKKLTLRGCNLHWEDISIKIGVLPLLQVLKIREQSFRGPEWETIKDQFPRLKLLVIDGCSDLERWTTDHTHFPLLEHLVLQSLEELKEIPSEIGDIQTLQSIELKYCTKSAIISAKKIIEEQTELGNESLQVRVIQSYVDEALASLAGHNFQIVERRPWLDRKLLWLHYKEIDQL